ncbi:MAG: nucleotidyltransferase domain-containing protein [Patescibacteria group bacterium]|nr:nucleotidyltransferase domain-containing protein [Patescibacteria group bacterium]
MLKDRILLTLKFFDLQDYPLTLLELRKFLLADVQQIKFVINTEWDLISVNGIQSAPATAEEILACLNNECKAEVEQQYGFYCLAGRRRVILQRWQNFLFGIRRERLIRRFVGGLRHVPFVRGVGLAGSQSMGLQKPDSDIDLFIIVDSRFLWLARTLVTAYFQVLGRRRHGRHIANRFCLNHYVAAGKTIGELRNLYTAWEYAKLRPLVCEPAVADFQQNNREWISRFFPSFAESFVFVRALADEPTGRQNFKSPHFEPANGGRRSLPQRIVERLFLGSFGRWLEARLQNWQLPRIRQEEFILVRDDELSFHPQSKQRELLQKFFVG